MLPQLSLALAGLLALALLRYGGTARRLYTTALAHLAGGYGVHPTQVSTWKTRALQGWPQVVARRERTARQVAAYEQQIPELYAEIGRPTTQVAWMGKKVAASPRAERRAMVEDG